MNLTVTILTSAVISAVIASAFGLVGQAIERRARGLSDPGMRLLEDSFHGLHGSDGVKLVPAVVGVVDVSAPDQIALADERFKIGTVVSAAGFYGVCLPYFALADRFED